MSVPFDAGTRNATDAVPTLMVRGLTKRFGATVALNGVDLEVRRGEVVAVVGDNGAGKSTLIKHISGVHEPDAGALIIDGVEYGRLSADKAHSLGIETIHQHFGLIETLDVAANLFLNRESVRKGFLAQKLGWLDRRGMRQEAARALSRFDLPPGIAKRPVIELSGGQQQMVAIARAVHWKPNLIMMDEPTAALAVNQAAKVVSLIGSLSEQGIAVLFVSHNMGHVMDVADRIVVLRQGIKVADLRKESTTHQEIVMYITGHTGPGSS